MHPSTDVVKESLHGLLEQHCGIKERSHKHEVFLCGDFYAEVTTVFKYSQASTQLEVGMLDKHKRKKYENHFDPVYDIERESTCANHTHFVRKRRMDAPGLSHRITRFNMGIKDTAIPEDDGTIANVLDYVVEKARLNVYGGARAAGLASIHDGHIE